MLEKLTDPKAAAKLSFALAVTLSIIASSIILYLTVIAPYGIRVYWDGGVSVANGSYIAKVSSVYERPGMGFLTKGGLQSAMLSLSDALSFYKDEPISAFQPKVSVNGREVILDYGPFKKIVYVNKDGIYIRLINFKEGVLGFDGAYYKRLKFDGNTVTLYDVLNTLRVPANVTISFYGCKVLDVSPSRLYGFISVAFVLKAWVKCSETALIKVSFHVKGNPVVGSVVGYPLLFVTYSYPLLIAIAAIIVWKKFISKNVYSFKGLVAFAMFIIAMSMLSAHHWDQLMAYAFGELVLHGKDLYSWTVHNTELMREFYPTKVVFFPGYAYLPQMMPFFVPLSALASVLVDKYFISLSPLALDLALQREMIFKTNAGIYYVLAHAYFYSFLLLTAYLVSKFYDKEKALLLGYSLLPLSILVEWGMYESFMLPFLVTSIYLFKRGGRREHFLSGLLWALGSGKIYPLLAVPALLILSEYKLAFLSGLLLGELPSFYYLFKEPMNFLYCTILYHMNRNIGDVNYFPSFMGEPVKILWFGKIGSAIEVALLLLTYFYVARKRPSPESAVAASLVPFLMFNRLVSPQHFLVFGTFALLSGNALTFARLGALILIHINLVRPSVLYLAYHWTELTLLRSGFAMGSSRFLSMLFLSVIPSYVWLFNQPLIFATLVLYYANALRSRGVSQ